MASIIGSLRTVDEIKQGPRCTVRIHDRSEAVVDDNATALIDTGCSHLLIREDYARRVLGETHGSFQLNSALSAKAMPLYVGMVSLPPYRNGQMFCMFKNDDSSGKPIIQAYDPGGMENPPDIILGMAVLRHGIFLIDGVKWQWILSDSKEDPQFRQFIEHMGESPNWELDRMRSRPIDLSV